MPNEQVPQSPVPNVPPVVPVQAVATAPVAAGSVPAVKYAGFWVRAGAFFIDALVLGLLQYILNTAPDFGAWKSVISILIPWVYAVFMVTEYQATLGKIAVGLHVQRVNGERVGLGHALLRETVGKLVSSIILGIGYLMIGWTRKKQGLHDMMADTVVLENDPNKSKTGWVVLGVIGLLIIPIVIVGLLSSVVLASLNVARLKGSDALVRSELTSLMVRGELYLDASAGAGYTGYCESPEAIAHLTAAARAGTIGTNDSSHACFDSKDAWAASVSLRQGGYACTDSTGAKADLVAPLAVGQISCNTTTAP